jgi:ribosomal protein S18 acetylase RimI-like enzyme
MIRRATLDDIPELLRIENAVFDTNRFTERNFQHLLARARGITLVDTERGVHLQGYAMALYHRGTSLARLYSMAVAPRAHRRGIGSRLLAAIEEAIASRGCAYMRLEVRVDNTGAQRFYEQAGYRRFAVSSRYYEDGVDAYRMEKSLDPRLDPTRGRVAYFEQSHEFTCGAAALMMAMHALDPTVSMDPKTELRLWREATTVFMCSGHGGCGPHGLALAAHRRGFAVEAYVSDTGVLFADSVRNPERRRAIELVQEDLVEQLRETDVRVSFERVDTRLLEERLRAGAIPIVLISTYRLDRRKQPHWVVITGFDEQFVYVHDPFIDPAGERTSTDHVHIPILRGEFERMARYGKTQLKAALLVSKREGSDATPRRRPRTRG